MRTAIYAYQTAEVTIRARDPRDAKVVISRFDQPIGAPAREAIGTHTLEPGIYLIVSRDVLEVLGVGIEIKAVPNNKDTWPDPKAQVLALAPGASTESIKEFFTVAKDLSVDG